MINPVSTYFSSWTQHLQRTFQTLSYKLLEKAFPLVIALEPWITRSVLPMLETAAQLFDGVRGINGTAGMYGAALRCFIAFGVLSGPACLVIDAPFGRNALSLKWLTINGTVGWLFMEIISPIFFLIALCTPLTSSPLSFSSNLVPSFAKVVEIFKGLPRGRAIVAGLFLVHYANRSLISSWRNPARGRMHISVPLSAIFFNAINGSLLGTYISGGGIFPPTSLTSTSTNWGISNPPLYITGIILFLTGLIGNIYSDEILYNLKRQSLASRPTTTTSPPPQNERYSIPQGFLYSYPFGGISYPNYLTEWLEWTGFLLLTLSLTSSEFPTLSLIHPGFFASLLKSPTEGMKIVKSLPEVLRPLEGWWLQPPALFLWNLGSAMLPRALSGHQWYKKTFGKKFPKERKAIFPGVL